MDLKATGKHETFLRVRDFGSAHEQEFPAESVAGQAFSTVARAAATIEQHAATLAAVQEGRRVKTLARSEIADRLALVARTWPELGTDTVGLVPAPRPKGNTDVALLSAARAFISKGPDVIDRLVPLGVPATILAELQEQVTRFEQAAKAGREVKALVATERAAIRDAVVEGSRAVRRLHVIVSNTFAGNPVQLAEWNRVRRASTKPKSSRSAKASATEPAATTPVASDQPAALPKAS